MLDLDLHAADLGVSVIDVAVIPGGLWGAYDHQQRAIFLLRRLGPIQRYSTLAHELGHAYHGHTHPAPVWEAEADEYAVRLLIPRRTFEDHARALHSPVAVAHELGVLPRLVEVAARVYGDSLSIT